MTIVKINLKNTEKTCQTLLVLHLNSSFVFQNIYSYVQSLMLSITLIKPMFSKQEEHCTVLDFAVLPK